MSSQPQRPPLRSRAASPLRLIWLLAGVIAATGCALLQRSGDTLPGPVRVRVGRIDEQTLHASLTDVPASGSLRVENLFDLFWDAGCAGEDLSLSPRSGGGQPDVVCSLPGRSRDSILVVAHVGGGGADDEWASAASLPPLYRALAKERRAHTFVFAGLGQPSRGGSVLRSAQRLAETLGAGAIVNLRGLGIQSEILWCLSSDARLRDGFARVGLRLGRRQESLRLFTPPAGSQPGMTRPPTIAIGRLAPDRTDPAAGAAGEGHDLASVVRLIAVYLGYLDQTLAPVAPAPSARPAPAPPLPTRVD